MTQIIHQRQWYLLTSKPHQDATAEIHIRNQSFEVYRPLARCMRKHRGKLIPKIESLFPRYLFVRIDMQNDYWQPLNSTQGVSGFVRFGRTNYPSIVPDSLIEKIRQQEDERGDKVVNIRQFLPGEEVVIQEDGAFFGLHAIFHEYDGEGRAKVLLEMLQQSVTKIVLPAYLDVA